MPLFWTIERSTGRASFFRGWLFGGLCAAFHLWWIWFLVVPVEPVTRVLLNAGVLLLFAYLGLYTAVFALAVRRLGLWSAPLVWPLLEFILAQGQVAFPWTQLGYSMTPWIPFIQPAALGGIYLVSSWLVLINLLVYRLLFKPRRLVTAVVLVVAFLVPLGYSALKVRPGRPWFDIAIIQPNVSPLDKGDRASRERIQADLVRLTVEAARARPDLVVYPETATLVDVTRSSTIGRELRRLVDSLGIDIVTGTPLYDVPARTWHNGAVVLRPGQDSVRQRHYKLRLVPFSEKIPYSDQLPLLRRIIGTADMGNWDIGHEVVVFDWSGGKLSCLICYEAIFPDLARAFARRGAQLLVAVTNDGWFGRLPGAPQHAELAVVRAVETGIPLVRSANNGSSFIVDPHGRVSGRTPLFRQEILAGTVPRPSGPTPYRRWGDWFIVLCLAGTAAFAAALTVRRTRARRSAAGPGATPGGPPA